MRPQRAYSLPNRGQDPSTAGFARTYDRYSADVYRIALGVLHDEHMAEDVTQEVFLWVWRRPGAYDAARGELGPYLRLLARSKAIDAWRRTSGQRRTQERIELEAGAFDQSDHDAAQLVERSTAADAVRDAVVRLPDPQREAIALAYWGGLSGPEIADRSGVALGTVKSRIRLGLARLQEDAAGFAA